MKFYNDETIIEHLYPVFYGYKYLFEFKDGSVDIVVSPFLEPGCTIGDLKNNFYDNECKHYGSAEKIPWKIVNVRKCSYHRDTEKEPLPVKFYW